MYKLNMLMRGLIFLITIIIKFYIFNVKLTNVQYLYFKKCWTSPPKIFLVTVLPIST